MSLILAKSRRSSFLAIISPDIGSITSSVVYLPQILSSKTSITSSPSFKSSKYSPWIVWQSSSLMVISCATSTKRLVKYPASAVLRAVSANPFLAPWVDMKYSKTDNPSLKLDLIGFSIISPDVPDEDELFLGLAISPLIPASCFIWSWLPLAPESAII